MEIMMRQQRTKCINKVSRITAWLILLTIPGLLMLRMETLTMGVIGHQTPDAVLYLSIADNFVSTGHFIQTARDVKGMVVPPGTPIMLTMYRLFHASNRIMLAIHFLMFGVANILLYETEKRICGRGFWSPIIYTMANLRCWIILGDAIVEHYYLFLMCMGLWIMYHDFAEPKKIIGMNLIGLAMLLVRPILVVAYLLILAYSFWWSIKNRKGALAAGILIFPLVILAINVSVNYRETGEFIFMENYSGSDMYVASRIDSPVTIEDAEKYMDETYLSIVHDDSLTQTQRNDLFKSLARENIRDHFGRYLWNGAQRGYEIFLKAYAWMTVYTLIGGVLLMYREKSKGEKRASVTLILALLLAVISSFGVSEVRYSIVIWPIAALHGAYLTWLIIDAFFRKEKDIHHFVTAGE